MTHALHCVVRQEQKSKMAARASVLRSFLSSTGKKRAGFLRGLLGWVCASVLHHRFFVCFRICRMLVWCFKKLILEILTKHAGHGGLPARAGFVCLFFKENFPIDGPLWEVPNLLLLLLWRHAFVCSKTKHLLLFVFVCTFFVMCILWQSQKCQYMYKNVKNRFKIRSSNV